MADISHEFTVKVEPERVFQSFASPSDLEKWRDKNHNRGRSENVVVFGCGSSLNSTGRLE